VIEQRVRDQSSIVSVFADVVMAAKRIDAARQKRFMCA
jgi:hypothetical protein